MATQSIPQITKNKRSELDSILVLWENRYKLRLLSRDLPRAIILALIVSIVVAFVAYSQALLLAQQVAVITLILCGLSGLGAILYVVLFPRPRITAARYFDIEFGLKERVSTAYELLDGRIQTYPEIETLQISDAVSVASEIDPRQDIEMDFRRYEVLLMAVLFVIICLMIALPILLGQNGRPAHPSQAVQAAQDEVRDITEAIAADTNLDDVDRQELLEALQTALDRLEDQDISDEEAFATMSQLQSELSQAEQDLSEQLKAQQSALDDAQDAMAEIPGASGTSQEAQDSNANPTDFNGEIPDNPSLSDMLKNLSDSIKADELTPEQMQNLADALESASKSLAESNPDLSKSLSDAAKALNQGDTQQAQQSMQQAQDQAQQAQQDQQQNSDAQKSLQQSSEQAQDAAQQISQQSQDQNNGESQSDSNSSQQQNASGNGQQQSSSQSDNVTQGNNPSNQSSNVDAPSDPESSAENENGDSTGSGSGDSQPSNTSTSGAGGEDRGVDANNNPTGDGEIQYEAIYNPQGIQGGGQDEMRLETDSGDQPLTEGNFQDNPNGESQVGYDTVFSDYQNAANRALESDYVPLGLRDVVRDYFTSLQPDKSGE